MADVATLAIQIDTSQVDAATSKLGSFSHQAESTETATGRLATSMEGLRSSFEKLQDRVVEFLSIRELVEFISNVIESNQQWAEQAERVSRQLGITTEAASALGVSARTHNVAIEEVTQAYTALISTLRTTPQVFDQLGVKIRDTSTGALLPFDQIMQNSLHRILEFKAGPDQAAVAMDLFRRSVLNLPQIETVFAGLPQATKDAAALGASVSDEDIARVHRYMEQVGQLSTAWQGVKDTLAAALIPEIGNLAAQLADLFRNHQGDIKAWGEAISEAVMNAVDDIKELVYAVEYVISFIDKSKAAVAEFFQPELDAIKAINETKAVQEAKPALITGGLAGEIALAKEAFGVSRPPGTVAPTTPGEAPDTNLSPFLGVTRITAGPETGPAAAPAQTPGGLAAPLNLQAQPAIEKALEALRSQNQLAEAQLALVEKTDVAYRGTVLTLSDAGKAITANLEASKAALSLGEKASEGQKAQAEAISRQTSEYKNQLAVLEAQAKVSEAVETPSQKRDRTIGLIQQTFPQGGETANRAIQAAQDAVFKSYNDQNAALQQQVRLLDVRRELEAASATGTTAAVAAEDQLKSQVALEAALRTDMYRNVSGPELQALKDRIDAQTRLNRLVADGTRSAAIKEGVKTPSEIAADQTRETQRLSQLGPANGGIDLETTAKRLQQIKDVEAGIPTETQQIMTAFGGMAGVINNAFTNAVINGQSFQDVLKNMLLDFAKLALQVLVLNEITAAFQRMGAAASGVATGGGDGGSIWGAIIGAALGIGGAAAGGGLSGPGGSGETTFAPGQFHAKGDIFTQATPGIFGEAGPEAAVPLVRGPGGQLGIQASGSRDEAPMLNQTIRIIDQAGVKVDTKADTGGKTIDVVISEKIARDITQGGAVHRAIKSTFGASQKPIKR